MTTPLNFRPIYDRHQGPYALLILRVDAKGKQFTDRATGSALRAQAAHEKAVALVQEPNVDSVYVFSDTEGQFTGALYKPGEDYAAWEHIPIDDAPPVARPRRTVKEGVAKSIANAIVQADLAEAAGFVGHTMVDGDAVVIPAGTLKEGQKIRVRATGEIKTPRPAKLPGDRFAIMRGRPLVHNPEGTWPKSAPAQMVRSHFETKGPEYSATSAELMIEIGPALTELGVQFPASLISRLKQAGLLKEKTYDTEPE